MENKKSISNFIDKILSGDGFVEMRMGVPDGPLPFGPMKNAIYKRVMKHFDPKSKYYKKGKLIKKEILSRMFPEDKSPT